MNYTKTYKLVTEVLISVTNAADGRKKYEVIIFKFSFADFWKFYDTWAGKTEVGFPKTNPSALLKSTVQIKAYKYKP